MFHILGFIFLIILVILIIGLGIIATIVRKLFNMGSRASATQSQQPHSHSKENWAPTEEGEIHLKRKKIFTEDEGEYVDFEEIK